MSKKLRRNRIAGIKIPEELRKRVMCSVCEKYILGTHEDPVISAPSLGRGLYHYDCAMLVWSELRKKENDE